MDSPPASTPPPLFSQPPPLPQAPKQGLSGGAIAAIVGVTILAALAVPTFNKIQEQAEKLRAETRVKELMVPLTEAEKVQAEAFVKELIQAVEKSDNAKIHASMDYDFLAEEIFHGFRDFTQAKKGFMDSATNNEGGIFREVVGQSGRIVRHWKRDGIPTITLRFLPDDGGASYFDILLIRQKAGGFKVGDFYSYLFGVQFSKQLRQTMAFITRADAGVLEQIMGRVARKNDMDALAEIAQASREGRFQDLITLFHKLSPEMKNQSTIFLQYVTALQRLGEAGEAEYVAALEKARGILGEEVTIDLLLMDRHLLKEDYTAARKAVEASLKTIGDDSYLLHLQGLMCVRTNDLPTAKDALKRAESLEPDLFDLVDLKMQIRAAEKDYAGVIEAIHAFKAFTGATITPDRLTEPVYDDFKKSPEFTSWSTTVKKAAP